MDDTDIEIEVFGMRGDSLAEAGDLPDYFDILVRRDGEDGEIIVVEEVEDLSWADAQPIIAALEAKYDTYADYVSCEGAPDL